MDAASRDSAAVPENVLSLSTVVLQHMAGWVVDEEVRKICFGYMGRPRERELLLHVLGLHPKDNPFYGTAPCQTSTRLLIPGQFGDVYIPPLGAHYAARYLVL